MSRSRLIRATSSGTFTPVLEGVTTAGTHTYGAMHHGFWQRSGALVRCSGIVQLATRDGLMAGQLRVTGFPFAALNDANKPQHSTPLRPVAALNLSANYAFAILSMLHNDTRATMWEMGGRTDTGAGSGIAGLDAATATGLINFNFDIEYRVA